MFTSSYLNYLESQHWAELRQTCFNRSNRKCEACESKGPLQGHHLVYRSPLETCTADDIMALCDRCHELFHNWLKQIGRKVLSFCRQSTRGAITALLFPARNLPQTKRPVYIPLNPTTTAQGRSKPPNAATSLRRSMATDARFLQIVRSCPTRKQFKKSVKSLSGNYPGCRGVSSFMTNALMVYKQRKNILNLP